MVRRRTWTWAGRVLPAFGGAFTPLPGDASDPLASHCVSLLSLVPSSALGWEGGSNTGVHGGSTVRQALCCSPYPVRGEHAHPTWSENPRLREPHRTPPPPLFQLLPLIPAAPLGSQSRAPWTSVLPERAPASPCAAFLTGIPTGLQGGWGRGRSVGDGGAGVPESTAIHQPPPASCLPFHCLL